MIKAHYGDTVKVQYTVTLENSTQLLRNNSLDFIIGSNNVPKDIERSVIGMRPGRSKRIKIPGHKIFGPYSEQKIIQVARNKLPGRNIEIGLRLRIPPLPFSVKVVDVSESIVTIDTNHPLAEEYLTFEIKLVHINESPVSFT